MNLYWIRSVYESFSFLLVNNDNIPIYWYCVGVRDSKKVSTQFDGYVLEKKRLRSPLLTLSANGSPYVNQLDVHSIAHRN